MFFGCSPNYEVVQQIGPYKYHIIGIKTQDVIILENTTGIKPGDKLKWRDIKNGNYAVRIAD